MAFLYIDRIGIEIEGGWSASPENYTHDGSVCRSLGTISGESVSPPYRRLSALHGYIDTNWPENVDDTCGYHIHMSFVDKAMYSRLMEKDFHAQAVEFWKRWGTANNVRSSHRFWKRLTGYNEYCKVSDDIPAQIQADSTGKGRERYYFLNFCHGFHKTMELRLLPAWKDKEMGVQSVNAWIEFVESFLRANEIGYSLKDEIIGNTAEPINIVEDFTIKEEDRPFRAINSYLDFIVGDRVRALGRVRDRRFAEYTHGRIVRIDPSSGAHGYEIRVEFAGIGLWNIWGDDNNVLTLWAAAPVFPGERFCIGDRVRANGILDGRRLEGQEGIVTDVGEDDNGITLAVRWGNDDYSWGTWSDEVNLIEVIERAS